MTTPSSQIFNKQQFKLAIVGASKASDSYYNKVKKYVEDTIAKIGKENLLLVSGGSTGVDSFAKRIATELNIPIKEFLPKTKTTPDFLERNKQIAQYADFVISFALPFTKQKCYHCAKVGKDNNHEKTAGCYTGYHGKDYQVIILS